MIQLPTALEISLYVILGIPLFILLLGALHVIHTAVVSLFTDGRVRLLGDAERALINEVGVLWAIIGVVTFPLWVWAWVAYKIIRMLRTQKQGR